MQVHSTRSQFGRAVGLQPLLEMIFYYLLIIAQPVSYTSFQRITWFSSDYLRWLLKHPGSAGLAL